MILEFIYAAVILMAGLMGLGLVVALIAAATVYLHKD